MSVLGEDGMGWGNGCSAASLRQTLPLQGRVWRERRLFPLPGWLWDTCLSWLGDGSLVPQAFPRQLLALPNTSVRGGGAGQSPLSLYFRAGGFSGQVWGPSATAQGSVG